MSSEFVRGSERIPVLIVAIALLCGAIVCTGTTVADQATETARGSVVKVAETKVTVTTRVQCRKYEGKVLHCTADPSDAVAESLDMRLLLGYTSVEVDGVVYDVSPIPSAELKFVPQGESRRVNASDTKEIRLNVIYVE